jgi:RimJ/RimL family protein N-acetyltransferase
MRPIATPTLRLEPLTAGHAREMFRVLSDPAIYEFENEPPASEEALARRYAMLERRASPDGREAWLNWVIRLPGGELAGYVQATVLASGAAYVAYELASLFVAVLKARNFRSVGLLRKLGFEPGSAEQCAAFAAEADELTMVRPAAAATDAA